MIGRGPHVELVENGVEQLDTDQTLGLCENRKSGHWYWQVMTLSGPGTI